MPRDPANSPPDADAAVEKVLEWLRGGMGETVPVEDSRLPDPLPQGAAWQILYFVGGAVGGPPYRSPEADATLTFQVTSCGRTAGQARKAAKRARGLFCDRDERGRAVHELDLTEIGLEVSDRGLAGGLGHVDYEGGIFTVVEQFYIAV